MAEQTVVQTAKFKVHAPSRRKRAELLHFLRCYSECKRQLLFACRPLLGEWLLKLEGKRESRPRAQLGKLDVRGDVQFVARPIVREYGLHPGVAESLADDVADTLASHFSLRDGGEAGWPVLYPRPTEADWRAALDALATSVVEEDERSAREELMRQRRHRLSAAAFCSRLALQYGKQYTLAVTPEGRYYAILVLWKPKTSRARPREWSPELLDLGTPDEHGKPTAVGEMERVKRRLTAGALVLPLEFGEHHEEKFFSEGRIRTSTLSYDARADEFYLHVSFELPVKNPQTDPPEFFIGIDRGTRVDFALAVVDSAGAVQHRELIDAGSMRYKRQARADLSAAQQRGRAIEHRDFRTGRVEEALHLACNRVLEVAEEYRPCAVVVEYGLSGIGGAAKGRTNPRHYQKMLRFLTYKLAHAGFPAPLERSAWKTSQICAGCGAVGEREGGAFRCPACGVEDDADANAAVNIARRGILPRDQLAALRERGGWEVFHSELCRSLP